MKIISVFNQKGGVGKTTSVVNLAAAISNFGKKTLIIDMDPQANTTTGLGVDKNKVEKSIYDLFYSLAMFKEEENKDGEKENTDSKENVEAGKENIKDLMEENTVNFDEYLIKIDENLDLIASESALSGLEVELVGLDEIKRVSGLKELVEGLRDKYEYIFIDSPPSLGLLSINALVASSHIIIPIQAQYYALEGVTELMNTYKLVKSSLNKDLEILGVFIAMFDKDKKLSIEVLEEVKDYFKDKTFKYMIPDDIKLAEAPSFGKNIFSYDKNSKAAIAYELLAQEIIGR